MIITDELNEKYVDESSYGIFCNFHPSIFLEELRKTAGQCFRQDNSEDSNSEASKICSRIINHYSPTST
jgi:hypothetical protein